MLVHQSYCLNNGSIVTSSYDENDFEFIAKNCYDLLYDHNTMENEVTMKQFFNLNFWTSIKVKISQTFFMLKFQSFLQFISNNEIIDGNGDSWNPYNHPIMDGEIPEEEFGVIIDTDGIARVQRMGFIG